MTKALKLIATLCCIVSILVIFIAPSVDSPDAVLPGAHHSVRCESSAAAPLALHADRSGWVCELSLKVFRYLLPADHRRIAVTRAQTPVLRC